MRLRLVTLLAMAMASYVAGYFASKSIRYLIMLEVHSAKAVSHAAAATET